MRLKEIKPGMVIHCNNLAEYERLEEETIKNGYGELPLHNQSEDFIKKVVFYINDVKSAWGGLNNNYIEFSDLILPELTPEETLRVFGALCAGVGCSRCQFDSIKGDSDCPTFLLEHYKEAAEICAEWKSDHAKKEPEIETVDICRIIEIQPNGFKKCVHEEDIVSELPFGGDERQIVQNILKRYCMEYDGEFIAVHEIVSRVKR